MDTVFLDHPSMPSSVAAANAPAVLADPLDAPVKEPKPAPAFVDMPLQKQESSLVVESEKSETPNEPLGPESLSSFKEESSRVADLEESEKSSLQELKQLVQEALEKGLLLPSEGDPKSPQNEETPKTDTNLTPKGFDEISIWGVLLFKDDRTDVILLKFLRARDFKVKEAFAMIKNTFLWRKMFGIDELLDEDLGDDLDKVVFIHGHDREGHPVCYNVYGEFQDKNLYERTFSDKEKRAKFLRWRIQFLERSIRKLDFRPGGVSTIFQVNDLRNAPGPANKELRAATNQALCILQDNYPEFVAKQVFINVPWWYVAFYTMINPFLTQRTKSKFVLSGPSKSAETLFKYISPEQVPIQYGGLSVDSCECNPDFSLSDPVTEIVIMPGTKQIVEILVSEKCTIVWEIRVLGWDVSYGAEFVPNENNTYTIVVHKAAKLPPKHEPVMHDTFKISELGKLKLTIDNPTSRKKKLLYRFTTYPSPEQGA